MIDPDEPTLATTAELAAEIERLDTYNLDAVRDRLQAFIVAEIAAMLPDAPAMCVICDLAIRLDDEAAARVARYRRVLAVREVEGE